MPNTFLPKKSTTAGAVPTAGQLQVGELALNVADGVMYTKDGSGVVKPVGRGLSSTSPSIISRTGFAGTANTVSRSDHAHQMNGVFVDKWSFIGSPNKTFYKAVGYTGQGAYKTNVSILIHSYWINAGSVTMKVGLWDGITNTIVDDDYYLTAIDLKNTGPALGTVIDFRKPGAYAGIGLQSNNWEKAYGYTGSNYAPVAILEVPSGGPQSGTTYVHHEYQYSSTVFSSESS